MTATEPSTSLPLISDREELLQLGICKVPIPAEIAKDQSQWAFRLSQVNPMNIFGEGDGEYAFYRNIMTEPELEFPLDSILASQVGEAILKHFHVTALHEIRLDDCFCVHYNSNQNDTSGAKHTDPGDITVNMCLEKTDDVQGSHVLFYGVKELTNVETQETTDGVIQAKHSRFLVSQEAGYATIHFGDHPHETTPLEGGGQRTNVILTYWLEDSSKSKAGNRTCYIDQ